MKWLEIYPEDILKILNTHKPINIPIKYCGKRVLILNYACYPEKFDLICKNCGLIIYKGIGNKFHIPESALTKFTCDEIILKSII